MLLERLQLCADHLQAFAQLGQFQRGQGGAQAGLQGGALKLQGGHAGVEFVQLALQGAGAGDLAVWFARG